MLHWPWNDTAAKSNCDLQSSPSLWPFLSCPTISSSAIAVCDVRLNGMLSSVLKERVPGSTLQCQLFPVFRIYVKSLQILPFSAVWGDRQVEEQVEAAHKRCPSEADHLPFCTHGHSNGVGIF